MKIKYEFTAVCSGFDIEDNEHLDRLYEAGCDDAVISLQNGEFRVEFSKDAETFEDAVMEATKIIQTAGGQVLRIERA